MNLKREFKKSWRLVANPDDRWMSTILLFGMGESTKTNCAAGIKRVASFTVLKTAVMSFVILVCGTSMPSKKDAMDIDQIGRKECEESWVKRLGRRRMGGENQEDQSGLNSLEGKGKGPKGGCHECGGSHFQSDFPKGGTGKSGKGGKGQGDKKRKIKGYEQWKARGKGKGKGLCLTCGGPHMQKECPQAGWGNPGYQVRSLDDPVAQFGSSFTTVELAVEKNTCRDPSSLSGARFFNIRDTDDDDDDDEVPSTEQGDVMHPRGIGSLAGARAESDTTSPSVEIAHD